MYRDWWEMHDWRLTKSDGFSHIELLERVEQRSVVDAWLVRLSDGRKARLFLFAPKATRQLAPFPGDRSTVAKPHPRITELYDFGYLSRDGGDCAYLVLQWLDARRLSDFLVDGPRWSRVEAQKRALSLALSAARTLAALEADETNRAGWVPGHLNSDTVWMDQEGNAFFEHPLLAQSLSELQSLSLRSASKYLGYMSPEQVGGRALDMRSDLFSFAVLLYELLTEKRLFSGESRSRIVAQVKQADVKPLSHVCPWIEERVSDRIMRALQRDVDARPRSWALWIEELVAVCDGPLSAVPDDRTETEAWGGPSTPSSVGPMKSVGGDRPLDAGSPAERRSPVPPARLGDGGEIQVLRAGSQHLGRTVEAALHPDLVTHPTGVAVLDPPPVEDRSGPLWWRSWRWEIGLALAFILALGLFFGAVGRDGWKRRTAGDVVGQEFQGEIQRGWRILRRRKGNGGVDLVFVTGKEKDAGPSLMVGTRCLKPLFWYRPPKGGWISVFSVPAGIENVHLDACAK